MIILLCTTCKKNGGGSAKPLYLSKVFINDLLSEEYIYSSDMNAVRRNGYNTSGGQSTFAGFRLYEYENGLMRSMLQYNKDSELSNRYDILYDGSEKITRVNMLGADGVIDYYWLYEYDNNQQLSKMVTYTPNPTKKQGEWQLKYNTPNNLVSIKRYYLSLGNMILNDSATFTYADKTIPAHWQLFEELMVEFPGDKTLLCIPATSYYYYLAGGPPTKSNHTFSQKTYNGHGYLTSQQYKLEVDNGLGTTTTNYNLKYEYIE